MIVQPWSSARRPRRVTSLVGGVLVILATACGGEQQPASDSGGAPAGAPPGVPAPGASSTGAPGAGTASAEVALGDSIFHGLAAGGTCASCHGPKGAGGPIAPSLADATWLHGDGSPQFIVRIVTAGVPSPKQAPGPMPPMGGASLSPDQVRAVAAYVSSLSVKGG